MPVSMIHFSVAKKVTPDASIDFYVGNLAPDAITKPYSPSVFPPALVEKLVDETAENFNKWFSK